MSNRQVAVALLALYLGAVASSDAHAAGFFSAPAQAKATSEALVNPGFESGRNVGWSETSSGNYQLVTNSGGSPHSGSWWAWMGGDHNLTETLSQQVAIPSDASEVRLGFWYDIATEESTSVEFDVLRVTVVDASTGAALAERRLSNRNATSTWTQAESLDLTAFRGRSVRLTFTSTTDGSLFTGFHIDDVSLAITTSATPGPSGNYSDLWWNPSESGWGLTIADQDSQMFLVWYTYRQDGSPTWFVVPGGTFSQGRRIFTGAMYETTGPRYDGPFNPAFVTSANVGTATIDFAPPGLAAGTALFTYRVGSVSGSKQIQRQPFGNAAPAWSSDFTDLYWNEAESGWGLSIIQHGNDVFGIWYTYDTSGRPLFVVMPGVTFSGPSSFSGDLYTTTGPYFGGPYNATGVRATRMGNATISFTGTIPNRRGNFRALVQGSAVDRPLVAQPIGQPPPPPPPPQTRLLAVTIVGNGTGTVTSSPSGINCPGQCSVTLAQGTTVTLTATASGVSRFAGFTGTCSTTASSCTLTVSNDAAVTARFDPLPQASDLRIEGRSVTVTAGEAIPDGTRIAEAFQGQPPYAYSLDTLANGAPPLGTSVDINGFLTGTSSSTYTTDRTFTFGVCVQDRVATRVCTTATARVMPPEDEPLATCTGSATITLTGRLRDPGQPICQGAFPLTTSSSIAILMLGFTPGTRQAQVEMDRGVWICQNDQPRGLGQFFAPIITISPNGTAVGTSSDNAGRFDISFTLSGRTASGTVSRTFVQSDANWTFTGNFSCTF